MKFLCLVKDSWRTLHSSRVCHSAVKKYKFLIHIQAHFVSFLLFLKQIIHSIIPSERRNVAISTAHQNEFSWKYTIEPPNLTFVNDAGKNV